MNKLLKIGLTLTLGSLGACNNETVAPSSSGTGGSVTGIVDMTPSSPLIRPPVVAAGTVALNWTMPTTYQDGTPLTLDGFVLEYGTTPYLYEHADILPIIDTYVLNLTPGVWFITLTAFDADGNHSERANQVALEL